MEGYTKIVIAALLGVTLSGAGAWVTWGRNAIGEPKVIELIETQGPYVRDKRYLESKVDQAAEEIGDLRLEVSMMRTSLAEIATLLKAEFAARHSRGDQ